LGENNSPILAVDQKGTTPIHFQVKEIQDKDLYTIFIRNKGGDIVKKTELYGKLRGSIDFINRTKKTIIEDFNFLRQRYEKYQDDFNKCLETIDDAFRIMLSQPRTTEQEVFLVSMDKIRMNWAKPGIGNERDISYADRYNTKNNFIDPLKSLCEQNIGDSRAGFIMNHLMSSIYAFYNIVEIKAVYRRHFLLDARGLQKSWFEINNALREFELIPDK
jgi:hypothetical protein